MAKAPAPNIWSAGTFLAKARVLHRRLKCWHIETGLMQSETVTLAESRSLLRSTFRDRLGEVNEDPGEPPGGGLTIVTSQMGGGASMYDDLVDDADRGHTERLLASFLWHLKDAGDGPAADYLREAFDEVLKLPVWTVRYLPEESGQGSDWVYMQEGMPVSKDRIDTLVDAAERLLRSEMAPVATNPHHEKTAANANPPEQMPATVHAIALMVAWEREGRSYTVADLAKAAGTSRAALYRDPQFLNARRAAKAQHAAPPSGHIDDNGNLDAFDAGDE